MKKRCIPTLLCLSACGLASAQEFGRVVSSTPVIAQVAVPRQVCRLDLVPAQEPRQGVNQFHQVQRCRTHMAFENRVLHYDVVYEYAGRPYAVRLAHDPGPTVLLQIAPVGALTPAPMAPAEPMENMDDMDDMDDMATIPHIHSQRQYVPYTIVVAPVLIAPPPRAFGVGPRANHAPHRPARALERQARPGHQAHRH